jgi:hypothetical protein
VIGGSHYKQILDLSGFDYVYGGIANVNMVDE